MRPQLNQVTPKTKDLDIVPQETITPYHSGKVDRNTTGKGTVVNCYSLHVRNGGSVSYKPIGYLQKGNTVTITGVADTGWYEISFKGGKGYCSNKYIQAKTTTKKEEAPKPPEEPKEGEDKHYIEYDVNTLTGEAKTKPEFLIMPRDIVKLEGVGKQLNGLYYVDNVTIDIGDNGFDFSLGLTKNAFGS